MLTSDQERSPLETTRLSHSLLWQLQLNYFDRCGIEAWRSGTVPHHITSSAFTAEAYARVVFGFFRDWYACQQDSSRPLHIVELGSGSGRFAYLFLKRFVSLHRNSVLKDLPFRFVMTDFTEQNLEYWRTHKWLKPHGRGPHYVVYFQISKSPCSSVGVVKTRNDGQPGCLQRIEALRDNGLKKHGVGAKVTFHVILAATKPYYGKVAGGKAASKENYDDFGGEEGGDVFGFMRS